MLCISIQRVDQQLKDNAKAASDAIANLAIHANEAIHANDLQTAQDFILRAVPVNSPEDMCGDIQISVAPITSNKIDEVAFEVMGELLNDLYTELLPELHDLMCTCAGEDFLQCVSSASAVVIGVSAYIGCWLYSRHKKSKQAESLKNAIRRCAAFRLFAQATLHRYEVSAAIINNIKQLANHYNSETFKSHLDDLISDFEANQGHDFNQKAFTELREQDKNAQPSTDASEDPQTYDELVEIFEEMAKKVKK
ncbi:hypothetical protein C8R42DRAFT_720845 [Lentinula raphanica]|nr:hypothetical protein C8R42DRAFT_720845 [Lentinula raphanica]